MALAGREGRCDIGDFVPVTEFGLRGLASLPLVNRGFSRIRDTPLRRLLSYCSPAPVSPNLSESLHRMKTCHKDAEAKQRSASTRKICQNNFVNRHEEVTQ